MKRKPALVRIVFGVLGGILIVGLICIGPVEGKDNLDWALRILVTVLSILAGILIAVITMLGDPRGLYPGNWRVASAHKREISRALNRFALLFWVYLAVIVFIFVAAMLEGRVSALGETDWVKWTKHVAISTGCAALLWSFALPVAIRKAQLDRLDHEVERRRNRRQEPLEDDLGQE